MKLAVIPARGGSKRIPRKNIKLFGNLPIIAWSIRAALGSNLFDRVIVSTDDDEIADIAQHYDALVPFVRPDELSDDYTNTSAVISHAIKWHLSRDFNLEEVCCIYATAPFIRGEDIRLGLDVLNKSGADFAFSVTSYAFPIQRALKLNNDGRAEMVDPTQFETRSQDLQETFHDAGQFYWGKPNAWLSGKPLFGQHTAPVFIPRYRVQDIDTAEDWRRAELMFRALNLKNNNK